MPTANITESIVIFDDSDNPSNPQRKHCDWKRSALSVPLSQAYSQRLVLDVGETVDVVDVGGVGLSNSFDGQVLPAKPDVFQFKANSTPTITGQNWATTPTAPGTTVTITVNLDGSMLVSGSGLGVSGVVGDLLYLAGSTYNDAGPFASSNQGFWSIVAISPGTGAFRVKRLGADEPLPVAEVVVTVSANDIQVISMAAVPTWLFLRSTSAPEFSGLHKVLYATNSWLAVATQVDWMAFINVTFNAQTAMHGYISYVRVEAEGMMYVEVTDPDPAGTPHHHVLNPPASGGAAWYEGFEVLTKLSVRNILRAEPLAVNLIVAVQE